MSTNIKHKIRLSGFLSLMVCLFMMISSPSVQAGAEGLKLTIALGKPSVALGEPVYVTAKLQNIGPQAVSIIPTLFPEDSTLQIEVIGTDGIRFPFVPYSLDLNDLAPKALSRGESIVAAFPIFFGGRGWTFQKPGGYKIRGIFVDPAKGTHMVRSEPVALEVLPDDGSGMYLIKDGKASDEAGKFLLWQSGDHLRAGIAHLESLVEKYPDSVVSDYALLAFAYNLSRPFRDYSIGKLRKADPEAAMEYLKKVNVEKLPPYLKINKIVAESRSQGLLGNAKRARSILNRANPIVKKDPALLPLLEQAEGVK